MISKVPKGIGVHKKLYNILQKNALQAVYKSFGNPHLDHAEVIYDDQNNETFSDKFEFFQYNAAVATTNRYRTRFGDIMFWQIAQTSLYFFTS